MRKKNNLEILFYSNPYVPQDSENQSYRNKNPQSNKGWGGWKLLSDSLTSANTNPGSKHSIYITKCVSD